MVTCYCNIRCPTEWWRRTLCFCNCRLFVLEFSYWVFWGLFLNCYIRPGSGRSPVSFRIVLTYMALAAPRVPIQHRILIDAGAVPFVRFDCSRSVIVGSSLDITTTVKQCVATHPLGWVRVCCQRMRQRLVQWVLQVKFRCGNVIGFRLGLSSLWWGWFQMWLKGACQSHLPCCVLI